MEKKSSSYMTTCLGLLRTLSSFVIYEKHLETEGTTDIMKK